MSANKKWRLSNLFGVKSNLSHANLLSVSQQNDSDSEGEGKSEVELDDEQASTVIIRKNAKVRARSISAGSSMMRSIIQSSLPLPSNGMTEVPQARKRPQFGISPSELLERNPDEPVPAILSRCVEILQTDLSKEGLFRIPGRLTKILEMKIAFEQGDSLFKEDEEPDFHSVASLLAQFFRELPEPLLTFKLYPKWISSVSEENEEKDIKIELQKLVNELPIANYNILNFWIEFLNQVAKYSGANRMAPRNLALVFGASLLNPPDDDVQSSFDLQKLKLQCSVIEHLIDNYYFIFQNMNENVNDQSSDGKANQAFHRHHRAVATIPAGLQLNNPNSPKKKKTNSPAKKKSRLISYNGTMKSLSSLSGSPVLNSARGESPNHSFQPSKLSNSSSFHSFEDSEIIQHDSNNSNTNGEDKLKKKLKKDRKLRRSNSPDCLSDDNNNNINNNQSIE